MPEREKIQPYFAYFKKQTLHDGVIPVRACSREQEQAILAHKPTDEVRFIRISEQEFYEREEVILKAIHRDCVEDVLQQSKKESCIIYLKHPTNGTITRSFREEEALMLEKQGWDITTEEAYDAQQQEKLQALREQQREDKRKQFQREGIIHNPVKPTSTRRVE